MVGDQMRICSDYSSDISTLIGLKGNDTLFISTWNKDEEILPFPENKVTEYNKLHQYEVNQYFFSDEFINLKENIVSENIEFKKYRISSSNFMFMSNGTLAAWLCILTILNEKKNLNVLLLSPIYYIYIEILKHLDAKIYVESAYDINYAKIASIIKSKGINLVILNNPLFGTGVCLSNEEIVKIQTLLSNNEGFLLIDNIYNGLKWHSELFVNDFKLYASLSSFDNFFILESLAKNLFLNGTKHCSIFSNSKWIDKLEKYSVFFSGSITAQQYNFIKKLYSFKEHQFIITQLKKNVNYAQKNYTFLKGLLGGKNVQLSNCESGTYCLLGIPRKIFNAQDDLLIAQEIMQKCNILTLPHDRYLYYNEQYYCFRINLMIDQQTLFEFISILQKCFNF